MSEDYFKETQPQTDTESAPLRAREQDVQTASGGQAEGTDAQSASCPQQPEGENMHPAYDRLQALEGNVQTAYSRMSQAEGENAQSGRECAQPASGQPPQGQNMYPAYRQVYVQNPQNNPYMQSGCNGMQQPRPKGDGIGFGIASLALGVASVFLFGCCVNYITAVLAVVFGVLQMVKNRRKSMAVAGIVTACISVLLGTLMWIGIVMNMDGRSMDEIYDEIYDGVYDYYDDQYPLNDYMNEL